MTTLSDKVLNSLQWIEPNPNRIVFRLFILLHGTHIWVVSTLIIQGVSIFWTFTSSPSTLDFYYAGVIHSLIAPSVLYQLFWLRKRNNLRDMHQQLFSFLEKLETHSSASEKKILNNSSRLITKISTMVILSFSVEGTIVTLQPVSNGRLPSCLQGLPITDAKSIIAQVVHVLTFVPLAISAGHFFLCETRAVLFLVLGFNILSGRMKEVHTFQDLREIASLHSEILMIAQRTRKIFDQYICLALCQFCMIVVFATLATIKSVTAPEILAIIPICGCLLFLICTLGETLQQASGQLFSSAYSFNWYESSISFQKIILVVLVRSLKPANMTASLLGNVCMTLSLNFLKMWYRFLQALLNII